MKTLRKCLTPGRPSMAETTNCKADGGTRSCRDLGIPESGTSGHHVSWHAAVWGTRALAGNCTKVDTVYSQPLPVFCGPVFQGSTHIHPLVQRQGILFLTMSHRPTSFPSFIWSPGCFIISHHHKKQKGGYRTVRCFGRETIVTYFYDGVLL